MSNENEAPKPNSSPAPAVSPETPPEHARSLLRRDDEDPRAAEARLERSNQRILRESRPSRPHD